MGHDEVLVLIPQLQSFLLTAGRVPAGGGARGDLETGELGINQYVSSSSIETTTLLTINHISGPRGGVGMSGSIAYRITISTKLSD